MSLIDTVKQKKPEILALAESCGVKNIRIFGSVVRGEETAESDIDFLVDISSAPFRKYMEFYYELGKLFDRKIDMISDRSLNEFMAADILREARPI